jgi:hypothetical protein
LFSRREPTVEEAKKQTGGLWMQAIRRRDGTMKRAFCLSCLQEKKPWIGGELCEHFANAVEVGPFSRLEKPVVIDANEEVSI